MNLKKILVFFSMVIFLCTGTFKNTFADVPYNGYTYDVYGRSVPTAVAYAPDKYVTGADTGAGTFKGPEDMYIKDGKVYILDSGNKRVVILDENLKAEKIIDKIFDEKGTEYKLNNPGGIFVTEDNRIFIADTDNHRVISINTDGKILQQLGKPASALFPQNLEFKPRKVIVDKAKDTYVISDGLYQGAVMYDKDTNFTGFYGANKVELDAGVLSDYFWKTFFMNKEQRRKTVRNIPTSYTNFYIDKVGFIYTCSKDDTSMANVLKKLNSMGNDILRANSKILGYGDVETAFYSGNQIKSSLVDVNADSEGFINVIDYTRGRVFQYDQDSNLIAVFGGRSNQVGTFDSPVAIESLNGKILVLDNKRGDLTTFSLTEFGKWIHTAVKLYNDGLYEASMEPWKEVLKRDNKLEIAYIGIGKALLKTGDYRGAMKNFKLGYDTKNYSKAYSLYMSALIRENISVVVTVLIIIYITFAVFKRRKKIKSLSKGFQFIKRRVKES